MVLIVVVFLKTVPSFVHIITAEVTVFCGPWSNPGRASACLSFLWIPWTWSPHLDSAWLSYTSLHSAHSFRSSLVFCGRYPPRILRARSLEGNLALSWSFLDPSYATDYMANSNFCAIVLGWCCRCWGHCPSYWAVNSWRGPQPRRLLQGLFTMPSQSRTAAMA